MSEPATSTDSTDKIMPRLAALYFRAREQGFTTVVLDHCCSLTRIVLGYEELRAVVVLEVDEAKLGAEEGYFHELWRKIGSANTPSTAPGATSWVEGDSLEALTREYLRFYWAGKKAKAIGERLLKKMLKDGRTAIDVEGLGAVTAHPASTRRELDRAAVQARIGELVTQLRATGVDVPVGEELPMKMSPVAAQLKVTAVAR